MKFRISGKLLFTAAAVIITAFSELNLYAEFVFLKDGSIAEGAIISDSAVSITIRDKDNKTKQIPRATILRVRYTKLKMGKIYVQKRDGEGIVAFIVDEDQDSYTFRTELYKPEEFILDRGDVLFMAEKNPSGLKVDGEIETDRVSLTWLPPYDAVKKYNIYFKKDKSGKYELADSSKRKSLTLKNLSSNTVYYLIVTSVDGSDYESPPSNELKITTRNIRPDKPLLLSYNKTVSGGRKIIWKEASDPDGRINNYRIYGTMDGKRNIISELNKTEYDITDARIYNKLQITAVDDRGDESDIVNVLRTTKINFYPGAIIPLGNFGDMYNAGYGGMLSFSERNMFFESFEAGISLGAYYLMGNDMLEVNDKTYNEFILVPLYLTAVYDFQLYDNFVIKPVVSIGGAYLDLKYYDRNRSIMEGRDRHLRTVEPSFKGGLNLEYRITDYLSVSAGSEYGAIIEKKGLLSFIAVNAGLSYFF